MPVDPCISINKDIARLQDTNKLAEQQKVNDVMINKMQAKCPNNQIAYLSIESPPSQTINNSDDLQQKYELKKSHYELVY